MTNEQLQEIKARCAAATPGPWHTDTDGDIVSYSTDSARQTDIAIKPEEDIYYNPDNLDTAFANMEFIAHAREDIPALIEALEELNAENEALREAVGATSANWAIEAVSLRKEAAKNKLELLNLTTPRKPIAERTLVGDYRCPRCNAAFIVETDTIPSGTTNFCGNCGQPLDWSQTNYAGEVTSYSKNEPNLEQENPYSNGTTNGDRIRAMGDEELAHYLKMRDSLCDMCGLTDCDGEIDCVRGVSAWLRQPEGE